MILKNTTAVVKKKTKTKKKQSCLIGVSRRVLLQSAAEGTLLYTSPPPWQKFVALPPDETKKQAGFCWMFAVVQWFESFKKKDISLSLSLSLASPLTVGINVEGIFASTAKQLGTFGWPFETCLLCAVTVITWHACFASQVQKSRPH